MAIYVKFTDVELKTRIKDFIKAKLQRLMLDGSGFNGVELAILKSWILKTFPDVSDATLLAVRNELKASGIIEEVTV